MKARYVNPYTDFGFKKLFGEEANKDLLIDFLNQLLPAKHLIKELTFRNSEKMGELALERKAIFDIYCQSVTGERFIVEMQQAKIKNFKDRALFYTTFPIKEQAPRGPWYFKLDAIYYIAILDFYYDVDEEKAKLRRDVELKDQDCELFFEKLKYIFLQMPAFKKTEAELKTHYDKWLYFLKNLEDFDEIPAILKEPIFEKAFEVAEIANFNKKELDAYERSLMTFRDWYSIMTTAIEEGEKGMEKGMEKGKEKKNIEVILKSHEAGIDIETISRITGTSEEEINRIIKEKPQ